MPILVAINSMATDNLIDATQLAQLRAALDKITLATCPACGHKHKLAHCPVKERADKYFRQIGMAQEWGKAKFAAYYKAFLDSDEAQLHKLTAVRRKQSASWAGK
jgi:rRNA maturation protein Nop10